ncbi:hypothetical protein J8M21_26085, partial [Pseudoalteromonas luteoviolacea]|nr:hypothetical protein [Pseudoalteromonas luteoviolacea]
MSSQKMDQNDTPKGVYQNETYEERKAKATGHWVEVYAEIEKRSENSEKYFKQGIFYEDVPKDHLHNQTYEQRLAKAAQLNGCEFKEAKPFKKPFSSREHHGTDNHIGWSDGQIVGIRRA